MTLEPLAIVRQAVQFERCRCPLCLRLDARHPGEGYQLALFRYSVALAPARLS